MGKVKFEKIPIGKVDQWLVDEAKEAGLDIDGFEHEITNHFVAHVIKEHGNEKAEANRGQIAIKQNDFDKIPEVIKSPDYVMVGGKYIKGYEKDKSFISYAKKLEDGTTFYYEVVLDGKNNKSLRGKTMYKWKGAINEQKFQTTVSSADDVDTSKAKIINLAAAGGYPGLRPTIEESGVVANPTKTQGSSLNISQSGVKSSGFSAAETGNPPPLERRNFNSKENIAQKAGYVQGVCECVAAMFGDKNMGKKLLSEMNVTKEMAKKYANPETYKILEQGVFAPNQEQKLEQQQSPGRGR